MMKPSYKLINEGLKGCALVLLFVLIRKIHRMTEVNYKWERLQKKKRIYLFANMKRWYITRSKAKPQFQKKESLISTFFLLLCDGGAIKYTNVRNNNRYHWDLRSKFSEPISADKQLQSTYDKITSNMIYGKYDS